MSDMIVIEAEVGEDGKLVIQLPPDAPRGTVKVTVEPYAEPELTPEQEAALDSELEELLKPENLRGQGLTAGEIARSPEIGMWKDRPETQDSVAWVEQMRRQRREKRQSHD
jgi:hypothetical protein